MAVEVAVWRSRCGPGHLRAAPGTERYTIAVGANAAVGAGEPAVPASGPAAPAEWPVGRVLVAPGPPPVDPAGYRRYDAAVNPPCQDPALD